MADTPEQPAGIRETDIVFDCPHCGKSLAIDYRGAGLVIPCTDCGKEVEVPIPEGMELTDIDSTDEEQEIRILNLRRSLATAEYRIGQLEAKLREATSGQEASEQDRARDASRFQAILDHVTRIQRSLEEIADALKGIRDLTGAQPL